MSRADSAKRRSDHQWAQRVSAIALVLLSAWFVVSLLSIPSVNYETVRAWMGRSWNAALIAALIVVGAQYSYLRLRVVTEDHVHDAARRMVTVFVLRFVHTLLAAAAVFGVFVLAFGVSA
jgi:succinate dehydrogenase / fumarate reductase membrane anchor subunit